MIEPMAVMEDPSILVALESERDSLKAALSAARDETDALKRLARLACSVCNYHEIKKEKEDLVFEVSQMREEVERLKGSMREILPMAEAWAIFRYGPDSPLCQHGADGDVCTCDAEAAVKSAIEHANAILSGLGPDGKPVKP